MAGDKFEGYPKGEVHDEYYFAEDRVGSLLHTWKRIQNVLDHSDPENFSKNEFNKYRTAWFSAIIGTVSIMLEEGMITDEKEIAEVKRRLHKVAVRVSTVKLLKRNTLPTSEGNRENDIMMTDEDVDEGDALLKLVYPYAVRLETERQDKETGKDV